MPGKTRTPPEKPKKATGTGTGTGTGSEGLAPVGENSAAIAQLTAQGIDEGSAGLITDFDTYSAQFSADYTTVLGLVQKAHSAQDAGDLPGWDATINELVPDGVQPLEYFLPSQPGILANLRMSGEDNGMEQVPAFKEAYLRAYRFGLMVEGQRASVAWLLTPRTVHGEYVPPITSIPLGALSYKDLIVGVDEALQPLFDAATEIREALAGASSSTGADAAAIATAIVAGPLGDFPPGMPEHEYLLHVVRHSTASETVKARVMWLLGRDDFDEYVSVYQSFNVVGFSKDAREFVTGIGAADTAIPGTKDLYTPGLDKRAEGKSAKAGPKTPDWDSSKTPAPGQSQWAEKDKPGTPADKVSDKGMHREQVDVEGSAKVKTGKGKVSAEGDAKRKRTNRNRRDGSELGGSAKLEAGDKLSGEVEGTGRRTGKSGDGAGGHVKVGRDEDGNWSGEAGGEAILGGKDGSETTIGKKGGYNKDDGVYVGSDIGHKSKNDQGGETETKGGVVVGTKKAGVNVGRTTTDKNENKKTREGNASYDYESGEFSGGVAIGSKDAKGKDKGTFSGQASIDLNNKDGKTGVKGELGYSKGGKSVKLSGGRTVKVEKPIKQGGKWVVSYEVTLSGKVAVGAKGKKVGASANVGGGTTTAGTRVFDTKSQADAFFEDPSLGGLPGDAASADQMAEGESRSEGTNTGIGGGVNAKVGPAEIGVGAQHDSSRTETHTKGAGNKITVDVGSDQLDAINGSIGMAGVSMGKGKSWGKSSSYSIEFDLSDPEGRKAYDHWNQFKALPRVQRGWRIVGTGSGESETDTTTLGLLGIEVGGSHSVSSSTENKNGHKYERDRGTDSVSVSIPLLGSFSRSHSLSMLQVDDDHSFFNAESVVKGDDLDDVKSGLGRSVMDTERGRGGSNKGTYRVQSAISEAQMDAFIETAKKATKADFHYYGTLHSADGLPDLQSGLRAAKGDKDKERKVLARWVADEGYDALAVLHAMTTGKITQSGGGTDMYVAIDNDPYMTGLKGQLDLELRIKTWDERMAAGERGGALASEIRKDIVFQREKSKHLEECGEIPARLYAQEYDRIRANLALLDSLVQRSLENDSETGGEELADPRFVAFKRAAATLAIARKECDWAYEEVYKDHEIEHEGAFQGGYKRANALKNEKAAYAQAESLFRSGEVARSAAIYAETLSNQGLTPDTVTAVTALVIKARSEYLRSKTFFQKANDTYFEIANRNIGTGPRGYHGETFLPGM